MAALNRPKNATYEIHENVVVDTLDNEDHTFCGMMFPIKCKDLLPIDHLVIKSVSVRGHLGPLTVWVSNKDANYDSDRRRWKSATKKARLVVNREEEELSTDEHRIPLDPSSWTKLYGKRHKPCPPGRYTELVFDEPFYLKPGEMRAIYIHSTLPGDKAIVYDNSYYGSSNMRFEDDKISILTGRAHVSTTPFGQDPIWGWGNAWRDRREFVGQLSYGCVYKLWNPEVQSTKFGCNFQSAVRTLLLCQRRWESPFSLLPDEAVFYILNMCRWDWFHDNSKTMKDRRKREKLRKQLLAANQQETASSMHAMGSSVKGEENEDSKPHASDAVSSRLRCNQSTCSSGDVTGGKTTGLNDSDEEDEENVVMSDVEGNECESDTSSDDTMNSDDGDFELDESLDESSDDDDDDYHRANRRYFSFQHPDSDDEQTDKPTSNSLRADWFRHQFARVHVLQALASLED